MIELLQKPYGNAVVVFLLIVVFILYVNVIILETLRDIADKEMEKYERPDKDNDPTRSGH